MLFEFMTEKPATWSDFFGNMTLNILLALTFVTTPLKKCVKCGSRKPSEALLMLQREKKERAAEHKWQTKLIYIYLYIYISLAELSCKIMYYYVLCY
jgi:hypothetical protein